MNENMPISSDIQEGDNVEIESAEDVVAAGESHTGAMIALKLTDEDAQRLAVDGGEEPDQLHLTLGYLGSAAMIPEQIRQDLIECISRRTYDLPTVIGDAFAVNMFNPSTGDDGGGGGKEPCVVLGIGGDQVDMMHKLIVGEVEGVFSKNMMTMHPQHKPWVAHITLIYTDDADLSYFTDRVGPIHFDAVRLAFGNDVYDIPLGEEDGYVEAVSDVSNEESAMSSYSTDGDDLIAFDENGAPIVPNVLIDLETFAKEKDVNIPSGPGHQLRDYWVRGEGAAKIKWGTPGDWTRCVAHLGKYVKDPKGLCSEYHHMATGMWTGEKRHRAMETAGETETFDDTMGYTTDGAGEEARVTMAEDAKTPYGDVKYADPGYQADGVKRYPLDTEKHIRAAWAYINMPKNASQYKPEQLKLVKSRIRAAMKKIGADVAADDNTVTAAGAAPASWQGVLTVEGIESGDGRMFDADALSWDEPPLPLMWQKETSHGGRSDVSVRVGNIDKIWREPDPSGRGDVNFIMGSGTFDIENPDGAEVYRRFKRGYMRGNSVDVDSVRNTDVELIYPESVSSPLASDGDGDVFSQAFAQPELTKYKKGRIRASTLVEIPAFTEARLELADGITSDTDTVALSDGVIDEEPEEALSSTDQMMNAIVAATSVIEITDAPPREWFNEPSDVTPLGALTITAEGRIYGYVAPANVRHRSFADRNQYVPMRKVDYSRFMGGETIVADGGRIPTGAITMNCGHASTARNLNASEAAEHYDNTCSMVATVRVGENGNGVWMAGALLPDVTPEQVRRMMASRLSGDWRSHLDKPGWREFVAALLVPVPGFPMARTAPSVEMSEGQLVAASVPVQFLASSDVTDGDVNTVDTSDSDVTEKITLSPRARAALIVARARVTKTRSKC